MMKRLLLTILAIYVVTHTTGCSSGSPKEESEVAATEDEAFAEEGSEDFADEEKSDEGSEEGEEEVAEEGGEEEAAEEGEEVAENAEEGEEGEEEFAESEEAAETGDEAQKTEVAATEEEDPDASEFPEEAPEETQTAQAAPAEEPSDENLFTADNNEASPADEAPAASPVEDQSVASAPVIDETPVSTPDYSYSEAPVYRPLLKIKDMPFDKNGVLMNRVYIGRAGDTYRSVSEKIYGSADRASELKRWNGASRNSIKVGEKVYYNSPREPQDSSRMLTYFEDAGVQPQIHTTADGENIRELGKTLLGDPNGWKELWSTNLDVESKGALPSGVQLKYWPDAAVPAQTVAAAPAETAPVETAPPAPTEVPPAPDVAANPAAPVDPMQMPVDPNAAPPADPNAVAQTDPMAQSTPEMAPPPVAGTTDAPPPPPPVEAEPVQKKAPATAEVAEDDMTTTMGIAGLGLVGLAVLFIMMKKNRARRIDLSQTQV